MGFLSGVHKVSPGSKFDAPVYDTCFDFFTPSGLNFVFFGVGTGKITGIE